MPRVACRTWRTFDRRDGESIRNQLQRSESACCPRCGGMLTEQRRTRMAAMLPGGVQGQDLECRSCRRFFARVRHTPRTRYHLRIRRLAVAVLRA